MGLDVRGKIWPKKFELVLWMRLFCLQFHPENKLPFMILNPPETTTEK